MCGVKDPSLANLPFQHLEEHSRIQKSQSNRDTRGYRKILSQLVLITLTRQNCFLNQSTMHSPKAYEKEPFPQLSLSVSRLQKPYLNDSICSYKFEFPQFKFWSQLGGYATGQNCSQLPCITTHHPNSGLHMPPTCTSHHLSTNCRSMTT